MAASLGRILASQHEDPGASELLEQTLALLRQAGNDELAGPERVQHLLDVALVYDFLGQIRLSQGDHDGAARLFGESLNAARSSRDRFSIIVSLYDLALNNQAQGDLTSAAQHLREGLSLADEAGDGPSAAYYLEALAALAQLQDDTPRAAHLLSASSALLQAKGSGWLHAYVQRASPDDVLAASRDELGDAAFEQAWAWGGSLGRAPAVQYALGEARADLTPPQGPP